MKRTFIAAMALLGLMSSSGVTRAQTYTWTSITSGNWDVGANWDTNPTIPVSADTTELRFNASGATSYTATNNIGTETFLLNRLTVNNTGTGLITLGGAAAANAYTFAGAAPTIDVQSGSVLFLGLMAGSADIVKTGSGTFIHDSNNGGFTGTLTINGGTFVNRSTALATTNFNPTSIVVNNGGTYQFGDAGIGNPNVPNGTYITVNTGGLVSWQEGEDFGGFNLNGGTIDLSGGNANTNGATAQSWTSGSIIGSFAYSAGASGARVINKTTAGTVTVGGGVTIVNNLINIEEGTISYLNAGNLGGAVPGFTLGGAATVGTFEYQGATGTRASNFTMNAGGGEIRVTNAATRLTMTGNTLGVGALTKSGPGTVVLGGTIGHLGGTNVNAGTLIVSPSATAAASGFTIASGATLDVISGFATQTLTAPTLNLAAGGGNLQFNLNVSTATALPLFTVANTDGLVLNGGTHTLRLTNTQPLPVGTYTAIDYLGTAITTGFTLALPGRTPGNIVYNTANTSIDVNVTGVTDTIRWGGQVNGTWDVGTAVNVGGTNNWRLASNNNNTNFIQTDAVTFDDTATGNFNVSIPTSVLPASVTVNNTANTYTFSGAGGITGTGGLTKQGTGTLVLATDNSYAGTTLVSAGTLQLGDGGTTGAVTGQITLANGTTLAINRTTDVTLPGVLSTAGVTINNAGTGVVSITGAIDGFAGTVITKTGPGTVRLLGSNSFLGNLAINGGTVVLTDEGGGGDLNAALVEVNNTGRFEFGFAGNPDLPGGTIVRVNTGGTALFNIGEDYGAIELRGGTYTSRVNNNLGGTSVLESGTFTNLDGVNGSLAGAGLVQKTTTGTVTFNGIALNGTGGLSIENGVLATNAAILANGVITFGTTNTAGTLRLTDADTAVVTNLGNQVVTLNDGGGVLDVSTAGKTYTHGGLITGAGPLTKAGAGTMALTGTNNYTGPTTVNAGVLQVNGQTGANSGTGIGAVTVASGGVLGGNGRVGGAITVNTGGTVEAGTAPGSTVLTTGSTVTLNGTLRVAILGTGANEAGQLTAGGTTTLGAASAIQLNLGNLTANDLRSAVGIGNSRNYTVMNTAAGSVTGVFANAPTNGTVDFSSSGFLPTEWSIAYGSNNVILSFTPVPEPALITLAAVAGLAGFARMRRRVQVTA